MTCEIDWEWALLSEVACAGLRMCFYACSMRLRGSFLHRPSVSAETTEARASDLMGSRPPLSRRASHEGPLSQAGVDASFERPHSRRTSSQGPQARPPSSSGSRGAANRSSHDGVAASLQRNSSDGPRRLSLQVMPLHHFANLTCGSCCEDRLHDRRDINLAKMHEEASFQLNDCAHQEASAHPNINVNTP